MKEIRLTKEFIAVVDDADYETLSQLKWCALTTPSGKVYATRKPGVLMHRVITNAPKGLLVDHKDGNGLNNTRDNLRVCTHAQNTHNSKKPIGSLSQYKGVTYEQQKWRVKVRSIHIGYYASEIEAAHAYDQVAREYFGEFAWLNFPSITV